MLQIHLSDEVAKLAREQSEAAGFGDDVSQFVAQLLLINQPRAPEGVPSPRTHEELIELLDEGSASGPAPVSFEEQMESFRAQLAARSEQ